MRHTRITSAVSADGYEPIASRLVNLYTPYVISGSHACRVEDADA